MVIVPAPSKRMVSPAASHAESDGAPAEAEAMKGQTLQYGREARLSRGLAFGSPEYVREAISRFRGDMKTRTRILPYENWQGGGLCSAGRGTGGNGEDPRKLLV